MNPARFIKNFISVAKDPYYHIRVLSNDIASDIGARVSYDNVISVAAMCEVKIFLSEVYIAVAGTRLSNQDHEKLDYEIYDDCIQCWRPLNISENKILEILLKRKEIYEYIGSHNRFMSKEYLDKVISYQEDVIASLVTYRRLSEKNNTIPGHFEDLSETPDSDNLMKVQHAITTVYSQNLNQYIEAARL